MFPVVFCVTAYKTLSEIRPQIYTDDRLGIVVAGINRIGETDVFDHASCRCHSAEFVIDLEPYRCLVVVNLVGRSALVIR